MHNMGSVATPNDPNWPSAATLVRRHPSWVGATSRSWASPPSRRRVSALVREHAGGRPGRAGALLDLVLHGRFDLAETVALVDHGDVDDPDGEGGHERVAQALATTEKSPR